jgi:hypothetical protein
MSLQQYSNRENLRNNISSQKKQWLVMAILQCVLYIQRSHNEKLCLMGRSVLAVSLSELSAWVAFKEMHCACEVEAKSFGAGEVKNFRLTLFQCRYCSLHNSPFRTLYTTQSTSAAARSTAEPPVSWCWPTPPAIQLQSPRRLLFFIPSLYSHLWGNQDVSKG